MAVSANVKSTKQLVQPVAKNAQFRSSQRQTGLYIAKNVSKAKEKIIHIDYFLSLNEAKTTTLGCVFDYFFIVGRNFSRFNLV